MEHAKVNVNLVDADFQTVEKVAMALRHTDQLKMVVSGIRENYTRLACGSSGHKDRITGFVDVELQQRLGDAIVSHIAELEDKLLRGVIPEVHR